MNKDELKNLKHSIERYNKLQEDIKAAQEEQKELRDAAWEKCGITGETLKKMAKESLMSNTQRLAVRNAEEELDKARAALGILAETPLGQAALDERVNGHDAEDEPQHHVTNPLIKAKAEKRKKTAKRAKGRAPRGKSQETRAGL